jgi:hypothetical protein
LKFNNSAILEEMQRYLEAHGFLNQTLQNIKNYLVEKLPPSLLPSNTTIAKMLRHKFHLRYGSFDKANVKYKDATYNDKRKWISKLLAQFFFENVIIISVDESNFRSDRLPSR